MALEVGRDEPDAQWALGIQVIAMRARRDRGRMTTLVLLVLVVKPLRRHLRLVLEGIEVAAMNDCRIRLQLRRTPHRREGLLLPALVEQNHAEHIQGLGTIPLHLERALTERRRLAQPSLEMPRKSQVDK